MVLVMKNECSYTVLIWGQKEAGEGLLIWMWATPSQEEMQSIWFHFLNLIRLILCLVVIFLKCTCLILTPNPQQSHAYIKYIHCDNQKSKDLSSTPPAHLKIPFFSPSVISALLSPTFKCIWVSRWRGKDRQTAQANCNVKKKIQTQAKPETLTLGDNEKYKW